MKYLTNKFAFKFSVTVSLVLTWFSFGAAQLLLMPVGDSITNGVAGSTDGLGFRNDLHQRLTDAGASFDFVGPAGAEPYEGFFFNGATIQQFFAGGIHDIETTMNTYQPNVILLHLGTNNVSMETVAPYSYNHGASFTSTASGKLATLLQYLLLWKNGHNGTFLEKILVCKIIPKVDSETRVEQFNTELLALLVDSENGTSPSIPAGSIRLVDQHTYFDSETMMSPDGIHPNDGGYAQMSNIYFTSITALGQTDITPPGRVTDLRAGSVGPTTAQILWKAPGDDGNSGRAAQYEIRYSQFSLNSDNFVTEGVLVKGVPGPSAPGTAQSFSISGLIPGIRYFVALRTWDEASNKSSLSNVIEIQTMEGGENTRTFVDYFDREELGLDWNAHSAFAIQNQELANTSNITGWNYLAAYKAYHTPKEVSFRWAESATTEGVNSGGFAVMLDSPSFNANGYLVYKRNGEIYLRRIVNGQADVGTTIDRRRGATGSAAPNPGDIVMIKVVQDLNENRFDFYINGQRDGSVSDPQKIEGLADSLYCGVMLYGASANNIDDFSVTIDVGTPTLLSNYAGDGQARPIGTRLPIPLTCQVIDEYGIPVSGIYVDYSVTNGEGYLSTDSLLFNGYLWQEAELGTVVPPMERGGDTQASNNQFVFTPNITGNYNQGYVVFSIYIPESDYYKLWGRVLAPDQNTNSCWVKVDDNDSTKWEFNSNLVWSWQSKPDMNYYLDKGFHTLKIRNRESDTKFDKFLLTTDTGYSPSGIGGTTQSFPNVTDQSGLAYSYLTFGQQAGLVQVQADVPGLQGSPILFNETALAGDPDSIVIVSGHYQSGTSGFPLAEPFVVQVRDAKGNPVLNAEVEFEVIAGGGSLSNPQPVVTDIDGLASTVLTLGYAEEHQVIASVRNYPQAGSVTFYATSVSGVPNEIQKISGEDQIGTVALPLGQPYVVKVIDSAQEPIENYPVHFAVTQGGGGLDGSDLAEKDVPTDAQGFAQVVLTLGDTAGVDNVVTATAFRGEVPLQGSPVTFTATAIPGPATTLTKISGDGQSAPIGLPLDAPFVVKVSDDLGNGVAGVDVVFEVTQGGGNLAGETQKILSSDLQGLAQVTLTIGPNEGEINRVQVTSEGLNGSPQIFDAEALTGVASELVKVSGDSASATVGQDLASPFVVQVTDPFGNPKAGVEVTFVVTAGDGKLGGQTTLALSTDAQGFAQATLTLGVQAGHFNHVVEARAPGLNDSPAVFHASATAADAAKLLKIEGGDNQAAKTGTFLSNPLQIEVTDQYDNPKGNHLVSFSIISGDGTFREGNRQQNALTNADGIAQVEWKVGTVVGVENIVRVVATGPSGGLEGSPLEFHASVLAGDPEHMVQYQWSEQTAQVNTTLPVPMQVKVTDKYGNVVPGFYVHFAVVQGGGSIGLSAETDVATDSNGVAQVFLTLGTEAGVRNNVVQASIPSTQLPEIEFIATALPAVAHSIVTVPGSEGQSAIVGTTLPRAFAVQIADVYGNTIAGHSVRFKVIDGGGTLGGLAERIVPTNPEGVAEATLTLGTIPGVDNNIVHAIAEDLVGSPQVFKASAIVGLPDRMIKASQDSLDGVVGSFLDKFFIVKITDVYGNAIQGHDVQFEVFAGGGTIDGNTDTIKTVPTNRDGEAKIRLKLGPQAGQYNNRVLVSARYNGSHLVGSPYTFVATARASQARILAPVSGAGQQGVVGRQLPQPIVVKALDGSNNHNPVEGHTVVFQVKKGGGTVGDSGDTIWVDLTNSAGEASVFWTLGTQAGNANNELEVSATDGVNLLEGAPIRFVASADPDLPHPTTSSIVASGPVSADNESTSLITVTLADTFGNRVPGRVVSFSATGEFNTIEPPAPVSNVQGIVTASLRSPRAEVKTICARDVLADLEIGCTDVQFTPLGPENLLLHSGNNQTGNVGTVLKDSLAVKVTDRFGNGISGQPVIFTVTGGGGAIVEAQPLTTSDTGIAAVHLILGIAPGSNNYVEATSPVLTDQSVVFKATGTEASAATLVKLSGDNQVGPVGTVLPEPLEVQVNDVFGKPVWGVPVIFDVVVGNGKIEDMGPDTTDSFGRAQARLILGSRAGLNTVQASVSELVNTVSFEATGTAGNATRLNLVSGDDQEARIGEQMPMPLVVSTTDDHKNPVGGIAVLFEVEEGDGSLSVDSVLTDANGFAYAIYSSGETAGDHVVKASSEDLTGSPVYFNLHVLAGEPTKMIMYSGNNQLGTYGRQLVYPVEVAITDRYGNRVAGTSVTFAVVVGGGSVVDPQPIATNRNGLAAAHWKLGPELGENGLIAYKPGLQGSPVEFSATAVANAFPVFVDLPVDPQVTEGDTLEFEVKAQDDDGDPLTYGMLAKPFGAAFDSLTTHLFRWVPSYQQEGIHTAKFIVHDNRGGFGIDSVKIQVQGFNQPPIIISYSPVTAMVPVDKPEVVTFSVTASDADLDSLSYRWYLNETLVSEQAVFRMESAQYASIQYVLRVEVSDGNNSVSHIWAVVVTSVELANFSATSVPYKGVRLEWKTTNERGNMGFDVLRSQSRKGEFEVVNTSLIPASEDGTYTFIDVTAKSGQTYYYKLEDVGINGLRTDHELIQVSIAMPKSFAVDQNYPNPFNPETHIRFQLPKTVHTTIRIYNIVGQEVIVLLDKLTEPGYHELAWQGTDRFGHLVSSGIYYYCMTAGEFRAVKKMALLR